MAVNSKEQALSLLAAANNHGDLTVKLSSLRQVKDLLLSSSVLPSEIFPFLVELQSSHESLVRKLLLQVMEEIGLRALEHSYILLPVLLALLKDEDPGVSQQCVVCGMKFFRSVLEELVLQFNRHGKVERWTEEMWILMVEFKAAVLSLIFEPVSLGTRLLALKFLETCVLLFTPDAADMDRLTFEGKEHRFNVSWLASGHPVLDPDKLISEGDRLSTSLLDMLKSCSSIPGPLTITVVNCLASIGRKRPKHYGQILSALLDFQSNTETRGGHTSSLQYSIRSALLGFLRCTHAIIVESRDRLVKHLYSMNAGDAADQALRQVDKMLRYNERSRDARLVKEEQPSTQLPLSGNPIKRKLLPQDNEELDNGLEMATKRMHYSSNGKTSDLGQIHGSADDNPVANGISSEALLLNNNVNPIEQMIAVIAALLAEGERGAESLELLISQIHPDLLADIVITNMKHLPKTAPIAKQGILSSNAQTVSPVSPGKGAESMSMPVHPSVSGQQSSVPTMLAVSPSLPDSSSGSQVDSRRDPRRDPRRLDPRRAAVPIEAPLPPAADEITHVSSVYEGPASVNKSTSLTVVSSTDHISPLSLPDADARSMKTIPAPYEDELPTEEGMDGSREMSSSSEVNVLIDHALSPDIVVDESSIPLTSMDGESRDAAGASYIEESDDSPPASIASASEDTCENLPEVPSYVDLSEKQRQTVRKLAVERILKSYKQIKNKEFCRSRMLLIARLVSWMEADDLVTIMVQQDIVLGYRDLQGHELVMHVLYYLHGLIIMESSEQSSSAIDLYEKFLVGVAKSLLDTLPASDKSFSRLLAEAPMLTDSALGLLENLCCSSGLDMQGKDTRDDRVTQGLGAVWSLILWRPLNREACLSIALKCAIHSEDDTRAKAIRLVSNKLYQLNYVSETIEQHAKNMMLSAVECPSDADASCSTGSRREVGVAEETSIGGTQHSESGTSNTVSQAGASMSLTEAQRLISLYFALCTKKPALLQFVFDVYARAGRSVKQAIHRHIPILLRALGSSYSQLLSIISDPPIGSENLLRLVLQILAEQTTPSPDLISTVKHLYETKLKDATILIPILSSLSKNEVLPIFPRLVDLPLDIFQQALAHILQGSAHTGPALTPAEVLVAIHDIVPEKDRIALKKVTDACSACFEQRIVFTQHVLEKALNLMVDRSPLPLLFMRTVIQAIDAFPTLVDFVMDVLSKLVDRQIWRMPKLWVGFLKCVSQTQPHSFRVLLKLPAPPLESALNKYAHLRGPLATYASQPNIRSSLPSSTLAVLGLANESHVTQSHIATSLHSSDTSSVRGTTST